MSGLVIIHIVSAKAMSGWVFNTVPVCNFPVFWPMILHVVCGVHSAGTGVRVVGPHPPPLYLVVLVGQL